MTCANKQNVPEYGMHAPLETFVFLGCWYCWILEVFYKLLRAPTHTLLRSDTGVTNFCTFSQNMALASKTFVTAVWIKSGLHVHNNTVMCYKYQNIVTAVILKFGTHDNSTPFFQIENSHRISAKVVRHKIINSSRMRVCSLNVKYYASSILYAKSSDVQCSLLACKCSLNQFNLHWIGMCKPGLYMYVLQTYQ